MLQSVPKFCFPFDVERYNKVITSVILPISASTEKLLHVFKWNEMPFLFIASNNNKTRGSKRNNMGDAEVFEILTSFVFSPVAG